MDYKLLSSPLQGFTEFKFRNAFNQYFGGIDTFYAPYIRLNGKMVIKPGYERDLLIKNNKVDTLIPQIMTNSKEEFLFVAKYVQSLGYNELNWNLGCPYPMVTKRGMGSGLINESEKIEEILDYIEKNSSIIVSMKMRLGYESPEEILNTMPILNKFPLKNIAIHARLGKQLYKGGVDLEGFEKCLSICDHPIYYNGDITTVTEFNKMKEKFPSIKNWMIGRGLISDPFLPQMIKDNTTQYPDDKNEIFGKFHDTLFNQIELSLSGKSHVLTKMTSYWEYWSYLFENPHKTYKKIKKSKDIPAYNKAVFEILN